LRHAPSLPGYESLLGLERSVGAQLCGTNLGVFELKTDTRRRREILSMAEIRLGYWQESSW